MPVRALSLTVLTVAFAGLAAAADWPQWRGPNRDGISAEKGLLDTWPKGGPPLAWKKDAIGFGYSSPVVVGDRLFIGGAEEKSGENEFVLCLNTKDGSQIWKAPLPFGAKGYRDTSRGNGPRGSVTTDGELLYFVGARGDLSCLKSVDGSKVWAKSYVADFGGDPEPWGYSESVLIDGDKLICTPGGPKGAMVAVEKKTGKEVWRCTDFKDTATYSSPMVAEVGGVRQYVTQTKQAAVGVRASDGKLLWRVDQLKRAIAVIPTAVVQDNFVFFTAGYNAGCELFKLEPDGSGGTKAEVVYTKNKVLVNHHGGVVRVGDHVYGHTYQSPQNGWVCFDFKKGGDEPTWVDKSLGKGSLVYADGHLYCYAEGTGEVVLAAASPEGWKEKGRFTIPEKATPRPGGAIWTHPVVANGKLYLRDHQFLFCYDVRRPGA